MRFSRSILAAALATAGANDGLWDWKLTTGEIYYSPRWMALFGYEERELTATPDEWFSRVHEADRDLEGAFTACAWLLRWG